MGKSATSVAQRVRVWDIPVRLSHLLIGGSFAGAIAIAELSDDDGPLFSLHMVLGLLVLAAALYRIVWGVTGTGYARFASFEWSPAALGAYWTGFVTGRGPRHIGHNPATSYAAATILLLALGAGATGILMAMGVGEKLQDVHELFAFALLAVALVHIAGVLLHTLRHRDDIVLSMIDGKKAVASAATPAPPAWGAGAALLVLALGILGFGFVGYNPKSGAVVVPGFDWRLGGSAREEDETSALGHDDHDDHDDHGDHGEHGEHGERHNHDPDEHNHDRGDHDD